MTYLESIRAITIPMDQHSREKKLRLDIVCNSQQVRELGFLSGQSDQISN